MKKFLLSIFVIGLILIIAIMARQFFILRKAHSTFENYYTFRGCSQLVKKTSTYGLCKLPSVQTIKIVEFHGKWYLDKDLPVCIFKKCF